jgi:hypothetical protein
MQDLKAFFDAYRDSFPKGAAAVAAFYNEPCVTVRSGVVRIHPSNADIATLFAEVDKQYRDRGYTHADCASFDCRTLGANSALATVRWAYKGPDEQTIWETVVMRYPPVCAITSSHAPRPTFSTGVPGLVSMNPWRTIRASGFRP